MPVNIPGVPREGKKPFPVLPRNPAVIFQPQTYQFIKNGTNVIGDAIRPTLGPLPRNVLLDSLRSASKLELLDNAAIIARRIIQINPRGSDVAAMLFRHALWEMHEKVGDGSATMGVIYQSIINEGIRYIIEFGSNPMLLRAGLEKGLNAVKEALNQIAIPLKGKENIAKIALGMCQGDREMADLLGEILDIVGPDGLIVVEKYNKPGLEREYIEGTYWHISGWFSRLFINEPSEVRAVFEDAALLITNMELKNPLLLVPVLERCVKAGITKLVITAAAISDQSIGLLEKNKQAKSIETMVVRTPRAGEKSHVAAIEDIAIMTGGIPYYKAAHENFDDFKVEDLGHVRRAWATESLFGIFGGKGDLRKIRQRIVDLRGQLKSAELESEKEQLQMRLGRLSGSTAIFRVGGFTDTEIETRKEVATRAVTGLRLAIQSGVVPGGGAGLLQCQSAILNLPANNEDEKIAYRILARALEEPMRVIASNTGYSADVILDRVYSAPPGYGFDAQIEKIVNMQEAGIMDSVRVIEQALEIAISGAAMTLTTDIIVHHRKPKESLEP
jgi:chaperonin GroEL